MGNDWILVPREPTEAMMKEGARVMHDGVGWSGASQGVARDVFQAMCRVARGARDAAPIVGEIDDLCRAMWPGYWWWLSEIEIDPRVPASMLEENRNPQREQMRAFLAHPIMQAALPIGGGAREAAEEIAEAVLDMDKSGHDNGVLLVTKIAAILSAHIPSAPAGLTEEERADISWAMDYLKSQKCGLIAERINTIISRLTGGQKS